MRQMACAMLTLILMGVGLCHASNAVADSTVVNSNLSQASSVIGGGDSSSTSSADGAWSYLSLASTSNYKGRTAPIAPASPYLPLWNHGGWGTVQGYFANGPTTTNCVYERMIDPEDSEDIKQLHKILGAVPLRFSLWHHSRHAQWSCGPLGRAGQISSRSWIRDLQYGDSRTSS